MRLLNLSVAALLLLSVNGIPQEPDKQPPEASLSTPSASHASHGHAAPTSTSTSSTSAIGHGHGHHAGPPKTVLDEEAIAEAHGGYDPLSYWAYDHPDVEAGRDGNGNEKTYGGLMIAHVVLMSLGFFAILPIGIALRATKNAFHPIAQLAFVGCTTLGWVFSSLYNNLTPELYKGESHSKFGYIVLLVVLVISATDLLSLFRKIISFAVLSFNSSERRSSSGSGLSSVWSRFLPTSQASIALGPLKSPSTADYERVGLVVDELSEFHDQAETTLDRHEEEEETRGRHAHFVDVNLEEGDAKEEDQMTHHAHSIILPEHHQPKPKVRRYNSEHSASSTLRDEEEGHLVHGSGDDEGAVYSPTTSSLSSPNAWDSHFPRSGRRSGHHRRMSSSISQYTRSTLRQHRRVIAEEDVYDESEEEEESKLSRILGSVLYVTEYLLMVFGFALLLSGGSVYTGICRGAYLNGCLAHLIKGGIFFIYGILTFVRYLGAWAHIGWSWNRVPSSRSTRAGRTPPTAEFVESTVIFMYGATQTWLERTGAQPGAPFATKEIQHIGIAVMFWFAGAVGMGLESRTVRRLMGSAALEGTEEGKRLMTKSSSVGVEDEEDLEVSGSYKGSFNPFPAVVIGVTGAAMAAHHQEYLFAVQVHALWGNLLVAFAVLRCLTYVFLWLKPPTGEGSVLPSRPPTEALAAFFLTCGGLAFIASTEQIVFAAVRNGRDDIMMIMTVIVAMTCLVFAWCMVVRAVRGWGTLKRMERHQTRRPRV